MKKYYTTKEVKSKKEDLPMKKQNKWEKLFDEYLDLIEFKLIESEKEQSDGFTEIECEEQLNKNISIWQLHCGWYVQCV